MTAAVVMRAVTLLMQLALSSPASQARSWCEPFPREPDEVMPMVLPTLQMGNIKTQRVRESGQSSVAGRAGLLIQFAVTSMYLL